MNRRSLLNKILIFLGLKKKKTYKPILLDDIQRITDDIWIPFAKEEYEKEILLLRLILLRLMRGK